MAAGEGGTDGHLTWVRLAGWAGDANPRGARMYGSSRCIRRKFACRRSCGHQQTPYIPARMKSPCRRGDDSIDWLKDSIGADCGKPALGGSVNAFALMKQMIDWRALGRGSPSREQLSLAKGNAVKWVASLVPTQEAINKLHSRRRLWGGGGTADVCDVPTVMNRTHRLRKSAITS